MHRSVDELFDAGLDQFPYKYYTTQHYPNHACNGLNDKNTNLTYYRQHSNGACVPFSFPWCISLNEVDWTVREYITWEQTAVDIAKARDVPVILTEYNTAACGGTNLSDTVSHSHSLPPLLLSYVANLLFVSSLLHSGPSTSDSKPPPSTTLLHTCTPGTSTARVYA